jgi:hypothetical protein
MADALAGLTLHSWQIGATMLVRSGKASLWRGAATSTIVVAVITLTVVATDVQVALTSIRAIVGTICTRVAIASVPMNELPPSACLIAIHPKYPWVRALNVKGWVVVSQPFTNLDTARHTMNPRVSSVPDPSLGVLVKHVGNTTKS